MGINSNHASEDGKVRCISCGKHISVGTAELCTACDRFVCSSCATKTKDGYICKKCK